MKKADPIPMYPDEDRIALEIMGPKRAKDWPAKAKYFEQKYPEFPRINEMMGGRFWPAVDQWFQSYEGVAILDQSPSIAGAAPELRIRIAPFKPDGKENYDVPETPASRDRRPRSRDHRERV